MKKSILISLFTLSILIAGGCNFTVEKEVSENEANPTENEEEKVENNESSDKEVDKDEADVAKTEENEATTDENSTENDTETQTTQSNYIDYSEAAVNASLASENHTVLFFHAPWCPTCKAAEKDFLANPDTLRENKINIIKTDFDTQLNLRKKYSVALQHTFILLDEDKNAIKKWGGGNTTMVVIMVK